MKRLAWKHPKYPFEVTYNGINYLFQPCGPGIWAGFDVKDPNAISKKSPPVRRLKPVKGREDHRGEFVQTVPSELAEKILVGVGTSQMLFGNEDVSEQPVKNIPTDEDGDPLFISGEEEERAIVHALSEAERQLLDKQNFIQQQAEQINAREQKLSDAEKRTKKAEKAAADAEKRAKQAEKSAEAAIERLRMLEDVERTKQTESPKKK